MTSDEGPGNGRKTAPKAAQTDRDARLKAALKANMAKRKAQAKARAGQGDRAAAADRDQA